ncbi:hypothetical protein L9F63_003140, partial [Diploptera punctata]
MPFTKMKTLLFTFSVCLLVAASQQQDPCENTDICDDSSLVKCTDNLVCGNGQVL